MIHEYGLCSFISLSIVSVLVSSLSLSFLYPDITVIFN